MKRIYNWGRSGQTSTQLLSKDTRTDSSAALFGMINRGDSDALPTEGAETPNAHTGVKGNKPDSSVCKPFIPAWN